MSAGKTLKALRGKVGITQVDLAKKSNVSQGQLSLYELDKVDPTVPMFERLLNVMGYELVVRKQKESE